MGLIQPLRLTNALEDLVAGYQTANSSLDVLSTGATLAMANAYTPLSLNRILLNFSYMTLGIVQTVVDQPVEDAFSKGIKIDSSDLDSDDVKELIEHMDDCDDLARLKDAHKWARLFGGGALIIAQDDADAADPFDITKVKKDSKIEFLDADRWELLLGNYWMGPIGYGSPSGHGEPSHYTYYGERVHPSRVIRMEGKRAPSFVRARLQGWGMSEIERCIRSINSFVKMQSVIFELIDEAKVDVYKIRGFVEALASSKGTAGIQKAIQTSNMLKSYQNALVMDKEDEFDQKTMVYSGLAEIYNEFRLNLASDTRFPLNKLFGQSATGFASGEDSQENYNSLVETEVRGKSKKGLRAVIDIRCMQRFGYVPDYIPGFHPLRVLTAEQEENVKREKFARAASMRQMDLLNGRETVELLHKEGLLDMDTEVGNGLREPAGAGNEPDGDEKEGIEDKGKHGVPADQMKDNAIMKWHRKAA